MKVRGLGAQPGESKVDQATGVIKYNHRWWDPSYWPTATWTQWIAAEYRSPTSGSDGVRPTTYCRKVARCIPGGSGKGKSGPYSWEYTNALVSIGLAPLAYGQYWTNPGVSVSSYLLSDCITAVWEEFHDFEGNILEDAFQVQQTTDFIWKLLKLLATSYREFRNRGVLLGGTSSKDVRRALKQHVSSRKSLSRLSKRPSRNRVSLDKSGRLPGQKAWDLNPGERPDPSLSDAARAWLQYYYGIKPLIGTISALLETNAPRKETFRSRHRRSRPLDPTGIFSGHHLVASGKAEESAQCQVTATISMGADTARLTSLGLTSNKAVDALVTAWALTPWSFVVDWILPVEQFLRTAAWSSAIELSHGFTGQRISVNASCYCTDVFDGEPESGDRPRATAMAIAYQRDAMIKLPSAGLAMRRGLTSTQSFNAVALILSAKG